MAKTRIRVSANFGHNLEAIEAFFEENEAPQVFETLLDLVFDRLIPNLESHPRLGRDFLAHAPGSEEGKRLHSRVVKLLQGAELREYLLDDYLVLYALTGADVILLSIKHHRQLSFDLPKFWT